MIFCFWDTLNDAPEFLGDDGNFWSYGEDSVAIDNGDEEGGRYWMKICKVSNTHPLNDNKRYEVFDPRLKEWVKLPETHLKTYREIYKLAGAECYE